MSSTRRWLLRAALLPGLALAWVVADLYLRVDLPGAAWLEHQLFRAIAGPVHWSLADERNLRAVALGVGGYLGAALLLGRWGMPLWRLLAGGAALAQLAVLVIASLFERSLALGVVVAVALLAPELPRPDLAASPEPSLRGTAGRIGFVLLAAAAPLAYLVSAFGASSDGYEPLDQLQALQDSGVSAVWLARLALLLGAATLLPAARRSPRAVARAWCLGSAVALFLAPGLDPNLPGWHAPLAVAAGLGLVSSGWPLFAGSLPGALHEPLSWPLRGLVPGAVALLLFVHAYGARIFHCPSPLPEGLTLLARPGEVFQLDLGADGSPLVMSLRNQQRWGRIEVQPEPGELGFVDPGVVAAPEQGYPPGTTWAFVEELLYVPQLDRFFGTALSADERFHEGGAIDWAVHNTVVEIDGDGRSAVAQHANPGGCWIGKLVWDEELSVLRLGCEYDPQIDAFDPVSGEFVFGTMDERLGDVAGLAVDPGPQDRMFAVSMWLRPTLAELTHDAGRLELLRTLFLDGTHYDLEVDAGTRRLFASSYYRSRLMIVDPEAWRVVGSVPTGLGTRPVAVDSERGLVLTASVYDGVLHVASTARGEVVQRVPVGGHVKDIALDRSRGLAYFASRCGLFRYDLAPAAAAAAALGPPWSDDRVETEATPPWLLPWDGLDLPE